MFGVDPGAPRTEATFSEVAIDEAPCDVSCGVSGTTTTLNGTARMLRTRSSQFDAGLRITWQEDAEVHESCMDRTVRGAEALIHDLPRELEQYRLGVSFRLQSSARGGRR